MSADAAAVVFESSKFWPVAIGFLGLETGYLVGGGEALFKFPPISPSRSVGKSRTKDRPSQNQIKRFTPKISGL